jgi:hypothetical protein
MKKTMTILACVALITACAKKGNYNCTCEVKTFTGPTETKTMTITDETSSNATTQCNEWGQSMIGGNGTYKCVTKAE